MLADKTIFYAPVEYKNQMVTNNLSVKRRMLDGSFNLRYSNMIYGDQLTNPNFWAKLVWEGEGLLPDYGPQKFFNGGLDSHGNFISMFDVTATKTTWRIMKEGTYNFAVALKVDGKKVVLKTSRTYVVKIMCDTLTTTKIQLAEERKTYHWPWNITCMHLHLNGVHLLVGSKVWAEFAAIYEPGVGREDDKIESVADGCSFRVHLVS